MGVIINFYDRVGLLNKRLQECSSGGYTLMGGDPGYLKLYWKGNFLIEFYAVGLRPSEVLDFVVKIIKACNLHTFAYTSEHKLYEPKVLEWRARRESK